MFPSMGGEMSAMRSPWSYLRQVSQILSSPDAWQPRLSYSPSAHSVQASQTRSDSCWHSVTSLIPKAHGVHPVLRREEGGEGVGEIL